VEFLASGERDTSQSLADDEDEDDPSGNATAPPADTGDVD
jgi:hypothetical protein